MAKFTCLEQFDIDKIKQKIKSGEFNVNELKNLTKWQDRLNYFKKNFDNDTAEFLNRKFDDTLIAKEQEKAFQKYSDTVTFKNEQQRVRFKESIKKNFEERKVRKQKLQNSGNIKDQDTIDEELYIKTATRKIDTKYGTQITPEQADNLAKINKKIKDFEAQGADKITDEMYKVDPTLRDAYGQAMSDMNNYIKSITDKESGKGFFDTLGVRAKESGEYIKGSRNIAEKIYRTIKTGVSAVTSPTLKAMKSSFDFVPIFRQMQKQYAFDFKIGLKSTADGFRVFFGKNSDELMQKFKNFVLSDEIFNKIGKKNKLAIDVAEEAFIDPLVQKVKFIGDGFKRSNDSFTISQQGGRLAIFKKLLKKGLDNRGMGSLSIDDVVKLSEETIELNGKRVLTDKAKDLQKMFKDIAYVSNSITGRGGLGKHLEKVSSTLNHIAFAPRYVVSNLDSYIKPFDFTLDKTARMAYQKTTRNQLASIAAVLSAAYVMNPDSVELRPNSSNFGKVKIRDKWIDVSGGLLPYAVSVIKLFSKHYVSGDKTREFSPTGYNQSKLDAQINFWGNKLAPTPALFLDYLKGQRRDFKESKNFLDTIGYGAKSLIAPISPSQILETGIDRWDGDMKEFTLDMMLELTELVALGGYWKD